MQYRTMPGSDEKLSILGYGCMRLPTSFGGAIDKEKAIKQIRGAIDRGVNYLDTAWPYHMGNSESFLGEDVLKDGYREKVYLATKLPCMMLRKTEAIRETFEKQLKKLQTDYIDYYLLHSLDGPLWDKMLDMGIIEFMDEVKASGKVRKIGFSFHGKKADFMRICDGYDFDFAQIQFNILDEQYQAGIEGINYAAGKGMGIIVMEPLRGGTLVSRMPAEIKSIYDGSGFERTAAEWALRWVWNNPNVQVVLSGMNVDEHINENIRIASEAVACSMSDEELAVISRIKDTYMSMMRVGCTSCAYCMPCPVGINIPAALNNLNEYHMYSKRSGRLHHVMHLGLENDDGRPRWTTECIDCGDCEKRCPQDIPVREVFKQVQKDLETPSTKLITFLAGIFLSRRKK